MALTDYEPLSSVVEYRGKPLATVRGLALTDCTVLVRNHLSDLRELWERFGPDARKLLPGDGADVETMLLNMLAMAPDTAAQIIALATDEPENVGAARKLSMPLQLKILIEVVRLTFEDVGGPLAFGAMVRSLLDTLPSSPPTTIQ